MGPYSPPAPPRGVFSAPAPPRYQRPPPAFRLRDLDELPLLAAALAAMSLTFADGAGRRPDERLATTGTAGGFFFFFCCCARAAAPAPPLFPRGNCSRLGRRGGGGISWWREGRARCNNSSRWGSCRSRIRRCRCDRWVGGSGAG